MPSSRTAICWTGQGTHRNQGHGGHLEGAGGCPSLVRQDYDTERDDAPRIAEILAHVSLRDHTFRTARIALQILHDRYGEKPVAYVTVMLIAALGHDLGKIPPSGARAHMRRPIIR